MIRRALLFILLCAWPLAAQAQGRLSPNDIARVAARPEPDARLPVDTYWRDQNGTRVRLGDVVRGKPTVLLFIDYTCGHICGPGLTLTAGALHDSGLQVGGDVAFVVLGFNPRDGPAEARMMADKELSSLPDIRANVRLLSADPATIATAEQALGFTAVWDPSTRQYAHDASAYVFNAGGALTRLLPETAVVVPVLKTALFASDTGESQGVLAHITTICYGFAAAHGVYGRAILIGSQSLGVLLLAGGALFVFLAARRHRGDAA